MADPAKTELTIRSTMTADSISPTVSISIRSVRSRTCTGTAIRDFTFRRIRNRKTRWCIPLSRSRGLSIQNATMISVKDSTNATGRPDIQTATDQPKISGKTRRPARKNLSFRSGQWSKVLSLRFWQRSRWSSLKNLKDASVSTSISWTGLCTWMNRLRTSMSGMSSIVKTVMERSRRNRKKLSKPWALICRIRPRRQVS